jgi:hypothetical protein
LGWCSDRGAGANFNKWRIACCIGFVIGAWEDIKVAKEIGGKISAVIPIEPEIVARSLAKQKPRLIEAILACSDWREVSDFANHERPIAALRLRYCVLRVCLKLCALPALCGFIEIKTRGFVGSAQVLFICKGKRGNKCKCYRKKDDKSFHVSSIGQMLHNSEPDWSIKKAEPKLRRVFEK